MRRLSSEDVPVLRVFTLYVMMFLLCGDVFFCCVSVSNVASCLYTLKYYMGRCSHLMKTTLMLLLLRIRAVSLYIKVLYATMIPLEKDIGV